MRTFLIMLVLFAFASAEDIRDTEQYDILGFNPIVMSEALYLQNVDEVSKEGSLIMGLNKVGFEVNFCPDTNRCDVTTAVAVELDFQGNIVLDRAYIDVRLGQLPIRTKAGYSKLPFGEYKTNLVSYPLLRYGTDLVPGVRYGATQALVSVNAGDFYAITGVFAAPTSRAESVVGKMTYNIPNLLNLSLSARSEAVKTHDIDFAVEFTPIPQLSFIGELYKGLNNSKVGGYGEIGYLPTNWLVLSARYGTLRAKFNNVGNNQFAIGPLFVINKYLVFGLEYNTSWNVHEGGSQGKPFHSLGTLLSFAL